MQRGLPRGYINNVLGNLRGKSSQKNSQAENFCLVEMTSFTNIKCHLTQCIVFQWNFCNFKKFPWKYFFTPDSRIWDIFACLNCIFSICCSWFPDQVSHGKNWSLPFFKLPDMMWITLLNLSEIFLPLCVCDTRKLNAFVIQNNFFFLVAL